MCTNVLCTYVCDACVQGVCMRPQCVQMCSVCEGQVYSVYKMYNICV